MGLPKIVTPEYTVNLFSVKKPVTFRPYLVKEEKLFMTAKQSDDSKMIVDTILQVVRECTFGKLAVEELPSFDLEYLFLQLRSKSVNNVVKLMYNCRNFVKKDDNTEATRCNHTNTIEVNLDEVSLTTNPDHATTVKLTSGLVIELKHPSIRLMQQHLPANGATMDETSAVDIIAECLKTITEESGTVYEARDYSVDERKEFVESIPLGELQHFETFFSTMPALRHTVPFVCAKCQYTEPIVLEGLNAFF